jgi:hypothetical protein
VEEDEVAAEDVAVLDMSMLADVVVALDISIVG